MSDLKREVFFEPGHDCIRFRCLHGDKSCAPGKGGSHGVHGLNVRWVVKGPKGAVQFLVYSGWLPEPEEWSTDKVYGPMAADLGYHALEPQYEGQETMECTFIEGGKCYYDGSGLNAREPFRVLCSFGGINCGSIWRDTIASYSRVGSFPPLIHIRMLGVEMLPT